MITPSKTIQQMKSDNEKRLELVIEAAAVGIWDWQVQTGEITFNQRWAEIIGYSVEELMPMAFDTWSSKVHPDDLTLATEVLEKHLRDELDLYSVEIRMLHKNGQYIWILASGRVVEWESDGLPKRMLGTHQDISERKATELDFMITRQLLEESQSIAHVGGWELNLETGHLYWTAETYRLHDTSPDKFDPSVDAGVSYFLPDSREVISRFGLQGARRLAAVS